MNTTIRSRSVPLWWLALAAALIPLLSIHATFAVAVFEGYISWCVPYWDSCTSISRTGRHGTAYFIFKGAMLPAALLGILFWWLNSLWLLQLGAPGRGQLWIPWLGLVACVALAAYTLALDHEGEGFNLIRRIGVVLYFSLTYIAQLLISSALKDHPRWHQSGKRLLWLSEVTLAVGFLSVILTAAAPDLYSQIDNAFEWILALLINLHALWVALPWRQSSFRTKLLAR
ncbi:MULTISPECIES: hypothetical protein [unclassified Marinobacter]|uniref:hypothetical protein n=1 Tax=unclassified Marinobacter TaxID=83889 RepID=UPI000BF89EFA|nr:MULTISPECIES: hypothetical protein [unclassified Marinobacter]PFG11648.1 hypothetical protein ATI45_4193 [Marinobacter sp. LV10MA510-1]PFG53470.1 hypothetical protein ATG98_2589 [Marinobacter sp. LV10R520-4]